MQPKAAAHKNPIIPLIILVMLFLVPMLLAWCGYHYHRLLSNHTTNKGILISPPFSISLLPLYNEQQQLLNNSINAENIPQSKTISTNGKWMLMLINAGRCDDTCQKNLYYLRQIRVAAGKNSDRIERSIVTFAANNDLNLNKIITQYFPGTRHLTIQQQQYSSIMQHYFNQPFAIKSGTIFIVDPLGNVMMSYHPGTSPDDIYKDLDKLLSISQIG